MSSLRDLDKVAFHEILFDAVTVHFCKFLVDVYQATLSKPTVKATKGRQDVVNVIVEMAAENIRQSLSTVCNVS
jgi:hypothetical protein